MKVKYLSIKDKAIRQAWERIESLNLQLSPFLTYQYVLNVWNYVRCFFPIHIPFIAAIVDSSDNILMMAPLKRDRFGSKIRMLCDIQGAGTAGFVYTPETDSAQTKECLEFLFKEMYKNKGLKLNRLAQDSPEHQFLNKTYGCHFCKPIKCVRIEIGHNPESVLEKISKSVKQNIRTAYNRATKNGLNLNLSIFTPGHIPDKQDRKLIMDTYLKRLYGKYKTAKNYGVNKLLYSFIIKPCRLIIYKKYKHDTVSLFSPDTKNTFHAILRDNNKSMAIMSGFMNHDKEVLVIPRLAINSDYSFYSPGYLIINELFKQVSLSVLDLSRGTERYKFDMGGVEYNTYSWIIPLNKRQCP